MDMTRTNSEIIGLLKLLCKFSLLSLKVLYEFFRYPNSLDVPFFEGLQLRTRRRIPAKPISPLPSNQTAAGTGTGEAVISVMGPLKP